LLIPAGRSAASSERNATGGALIVLVARSGNCLPESGSRTTGA
jgi:hypothetical protein